MTGADLRSRAASDPPRDGAGTLAASMGGEDRLRIAMVAPVALPVPPSGYGGTERVVSVLTEALVARGHDVTLFALHGSTSAARIVSTVATAPHPDDPQRAVDDLTHVLAAYLHADGFDVVHDHTTLGPAVGAVLPMPPVVHTLHGPWTERTRHFLEPIADRVALVAISRAQAEANPAASCIDVVPNGLDVDAHPFRSKKDSHLVFVGRINPDKGVVAAIQVAHRVGRPLKIVAKRQERLEWEYWDTVVAPLLGREDEVFEQPPEAVKLDLLASAHATLFPIQWPEPFGLVMIESMAAGTPVITRNVGAAPEVVLDGVTGFVCETVEEMAVAVERVAELDPVACRKRVEAGFSARSMTDGYEAVYRRVLMDAGARRGGGHR